MTAGGEQVLGGMTRARFFADHWQKRPLLVRGAMPGFRGIIGLQRLLRLSERAEAMSRIVTTTAAPGAGGSERVRYTVLGGPFARDELATLASGGDPWTVLVQGIESLVPGGWELLRAFELLPRARLDDLMVSYATEGASVGPHVDKYDVFLLQGPGRRRWRIATHGAWEADVRAGRPVLRPFRAEEDWVLEPGDMLYLPPRVAHWGTAVDGPCFTYSIGAVAPTHEALLQNFLGYLSERVVEAADDGMIEDPDLAPGPDPFALDDAMVARVARVIEGLRFNDDDVTDFLGRLLTGPKPQVRFTLPRRPPGATGIARLLARPGMLRLALPSRGLVRGARGFLNGHSFDLTSSEGTPFSALLRERALRLPLSAKAARAWSERVATWHANGWVGFA